MTTGNWRVLIRIRCIATLLLATLWLAGCVPPKVPGPGDDGLFVGQAAAVAPCDVPRGCFKARTRDGSCRLVTCSCQHYCGKRGIHPMWAPTPEGCPCGG